MEGRQLLEDDLEPVGFAWSAFLGWLLVAGGLYFLLRMTGFFVRQDELLTTRH